MSEYRAGTLEELRALGVLRVSLAPAETGRPRAALVALAEDGRPRAYVDRCRHLPIPLDASHRYLTEDRRALLCATHGAQFRVRDGMCILGPCKGLPLYALPLHEHDDALWVTDTHPDGI